MANVIARGHSFRLVDFFLTLPLQVWPIAKLATWGPSPMWLHHKIWEKEHLGLDATHKQLGFFHGTNVGAHSHKANNKLNWHGPKIEISPFNVFLGQNLGFFLKILFSSVNSSSFSSF